MTEGVELRIRKGAGDEVEGQIEVRLSVISNCPIMETAMQIRTREKYVKAKLTAW